MKKVIAILISSLIATPALANYEALRSSEYEKFIDHQEYLLQLDSIEQNSQDRQKESFMLQEETLPIYSNTRCTHVHSCSGTSGSDDWREPII